MKSLDIFQMNKTLLISKISSLLKLTVFILPLTFSFLSCEKEKEIEINIGEPISISSASNEIVLNQKQTYNTAIDFSWTTGSNQGTGASISYTLQMDIEGNNFTKMRSSDLGKAVYRYELNVAVLNDWLLNYWAVEANSTTNLQARVIANVSSVEVQPDTSDVLSLAVTSYEPVSSTLYLIGDATQNGWDINNAIPMIADLKDPTTFTFFGALGVGEIKFITTLGSALPSYQKGEDENTLVLRTDNSQPDERFKILEPAKYNISLNLVDLIVDIKLVPGSAYDSLFIIGSATPVGWDIANAIQLTQNPDNLFQFIYEGVLSPGEFKFPVNRNTDWGQDMFMRDTEDSSKIYLHKGGDTDDNSWTIEKENRYTVVIDLLDNSITIKPFVLYFIGSATPVGWSINKAIEMVQDETDWYIFTYTGPLVAGEFKFPFNRNSDWGQDMYMKDPADPSKMYRHTGGEVDDSKWILTAADAGNYVLTLNVEELTIDIKKE